MYSCNQGLIVSHAAQYTPLHHPPVPSLSCLQILILHNESVVVASIAAVTYGLMKYAGPDIAATLDERAQSIHTSLEQGRKARITAIEAEIEEQVQTLCP